MSEAPTESLSVEQRADGVAIVRFDLPGEPVNTLQASFAAEFLRVLEKLEENPSLKAVLLV